MNDLKARVRETVLQERDSISPDERARKSAVICAQLASLLQGLLADHTTPPISVYHAMRSEVMLDVFISDAYALGANVCFPCMTRGAEGHSVMVMRSVPRAFFEQDTIPFLNHPMKVFDAEDPALADFPLVPPEAFALVVVPLVAYDQQNNRLGYGGGNYDAFLATISPTCKVTGVAFAEQEYPEIPTEPHDKRLPAIITDRR